MRNKIDKIEGLCLTASSGKFPHAVLLETNNIAEEGMDSALYIAKILLCRNESSKPCNKCEACRKIDLKAHPDVQIVEPKQSYKSIRTDDIRALKADAYLSPNESDYKIYIINDGSLMNEQAQNVFLKILEEPPSTVKFIILCESRFSLLPTVRSRVQIFELGRVGKTAESSKVNKIVDGIFEACIKKSNFGLVKETAVLAKDKELFKRVIENMENTISGVCISKSRNFDCDEHKNLDLLSLDTLLRMRDVIMEANTLFQRNINNQLLVCYLCIKLSNC